MHLLCRRGSAQRAVERVEGNAVAFSALPLFTDGYVSALILFSVLVAALAGTYTPGLVLLAERFTPERRGYRVVSPRWLPLRSQTG